MPPIRRSLLREAIKDSSFRALALALLGRRLLRRPWQGSILVECYPGLPRHKEVIWKVALLAGMRLARPSGARHADEVRRLRLHWGGRTGLDPTAPASPTPDWAYAVNARVRDTGKRHVAQVFAATFGYNLAIDPTEHVGPCVTKSNANSAHDGRVLDCPMPTADPQLAYEILVDNRVNEREVLDLRVPVVGDELPFVYLKRRPIGTRFANRNSVVEFGSTDALLSPGEQASIREFCRSMALDLGELDVLRDAGSGRIFIVDVNSMPFGPPKPIAHRDALRAITLYSHALLRFAYRLLDEQADRANGHLPQRVPFARPTVGTDALSCRLRVLQCYRQGETYRGTAEAAVLGPDPPAEMLDDLPAQIEPEAGTRWACP